LHGSVIGAGEQSAALFGEGWWLRWWLRWWTFVIEDGVVVPWEGVCPGRYVVDGLGVVVDGTNGIDVLLEEGRRFLGCRAVHRERFGRHRCLVGCAGSQGSDDPTRRTFELHGPRCSHGKETLGTSARRPRGRSFSRTSGGETKLSG
jgi:hypothetical protein